MEQKDLVTKDEEDIIMNVLRQFNLDISDANLVTDQLTQILEETEQENIHAILEKQAEWNDIIMQMKDTRVQLTDIKTWIDHYNEKLMIMQKDIEQIESENNEMEIQARNHHQLSEELRKLMEKLELDAKFEDALLMEPFDTNESLNRILESVAVLEEALNTDLKDGMQRMLAVTERIFYFQQLREKLVNRFKLFLKKHFTKLGDQCIKDMKTNWRKSRAAGDQLYIDHPLHKIIYKDLLKYLPLMKSVMASDVTGQMKLGYATAMQAPYRKELHEYFYEIKSAIKKNKESRATLSFTLVTNTSPTAAGPHAGHRDSVRMTPSSATTTHDMDDDEYSDDTMSQISTMSSIPSISVAEMRVDRAFSKCLSDVCQIVFDEQQFCVKFFHLDIHHRLDQSSSNDVHQSSGSEYATPADSAATLSQRNIQTAIQQGMETELQKMLERMFKNLLTMFKTQIGWIERRTDKFFMINMLVVTEKKFNEYQGKSTFLRFLLADILAAVNSIFNHFIDKQIESVKEYKCVIKKTPIAPFVSRFLHFVDRLENILVEPTERRHIETAYLKIIKVIFDQLETLAETDAKHSNAFRLRNYMFFHRAVNNRRFKSAGIDKFLATAEKIYVPCMQNYVMWIVRSKFGDLFDFFDGVEACLKTIEPEEVSFQNAYSKTKVRDLIKRRSATFQKDILDMMKRMEKHVNVQVGSSCNLYGEVWNHLRKVFLERYRTMEQLVLKCYTNTTLAPDSSKAAEMFATVESANAMKL